MTNDVRRYEERNGTEILGIFMMGLYYFSDLPEQLKDSNWELGEQSLKP